MRTGDTPDTNCAEIENFDFGGVGIKKEFRPIWKHQIDFSVILLIWNKIMLLKSEIKINSYAVDAAIISAETLWKFLLALSILCCMY